MAAFSPKKLQSSKIQLSCPPQILPANPLILGWFNDIIGNCGKNLCNSWRVMVKLLLVKKYFSALKCCSTLLLLYLLRKDTLSFYFCQEKTSACRLGFLVVRTWVNRNQTLALKRKPKLLIGHTKTVAHIRRRALQHVKSFSLPRVGQGIHSSLLEKQACFEKNF